MSSSNYPSRSSTAWTLARPYEPRLPSRRIAQLRTRLPERTTPPKSGLGHQRRFKRRSRTYASPPIPDISLRPLLGDQSDDPRRGPAHRRQLTKLPELLRRKPGDRPAQPRKPVLRSFLPQGPRQRLFRASEGRSITAPAPKWTDADDEEASKSVVLASHLAEAQPAAPPLVGGQ